MLNGRKKHEITNPYEQQKENSRYTLMYLNIRSFIHTKNI